MRQTKHLAKILSLFEHGHLYTGAELVAKLPEMDKATVYRNLEKLVKEDILREVNIKKGITSYELNKDHHQHLICTHCNKIYEIEIDQNELKKILKKKGLEIDDDFQVNILARIKLHK